MIFYKDLPIIPSLLILYVIVYHIILKLTLLSITQFNSIPYHTSTSNNRAVHKYILLDPHHPASSLFKQWASIHPIIPCLLWATQISHVCWTPPPLRCAYSKGLSCQLQRNWCVCVLVCMYVCVGGRGGGGLNVRDQELPWCDIRINKTSGLSWSKLSCLFMNKSWFVLKQLAQS